MMDPEPAAAILPHRRHHRPQGCNNNISDTQSYSDANIASIDKKSSSTSTNDVHDNAHDDNENENDYADDSLLYLDTQSEPPAYYATI